MSKLLVKEKEIVVPGEVLAEGMDNHHGKGLSNAKILIIGVTYKKNINDVRESPAVNILKKLQEKRAEVSYYDPFVPEFLLENQSTMHSLDLSQEVIKDHDIILICTDHSDIDYELIAKNARVIVDTRNVLKEYNLPHIMKA